ncbi:hypothetical protein EXS72_02290 [Candidatus Pacearchaeota archaeon]|nr:hypothetical protein [Candidatus Pacearchaeota archaeon]
MRKKCPELHAEIEEKIERLEEEGHPKSYIKELEKEIKEIKHKFSKIKKKFSIKYRIKLSQAHKDKHFLR